MTTQTQTDSQSVKIDRKASAETVVGFAILGCFVTAAVGIDKATQMQNGLDVCFCLLGSVAALGLVFYIYFRKH